jgi:uncharacterized membrane protein YcaP (DUF421 family)
MDWSTFFSSWDGLIRVFVVGTLAYVALVLLLRVSGNRTLSKMNAFDLVVTVALGSTLATIILSKDVALAEGVIAFALLIGLQFGITWLSVRSGTVRHLVKSEPALLFYQGQFLPDQMRRSRVLEAEVRAAIREQGIAGLRDVEAVVLETDGAFSVVTRGKGLATSLASLAPPESQYDRSRSKE